MFFDLTSQVQHVIRWQLRMSTVCSCGLSSNGRETFGWDGLHHCFFMARSAVAPQSIPRHIELMGNPLQWIAPRTKPWFRLRICSFGTWWPYFTIFLTLLELYLYMIIPSWNRWSSETRTPDEPRVKPEKTHLKPLSVLQNWMTVENLQERLSCGVRYHRIGWEHLQATPTFDVENMGKPWCFL